MRIWAFLALMLLVASPVFAALQANSTISPLYVDTSVVNQSFVYTVNSLNESINWIAINSSGAHNFTGVSDVTLNGTSCRGVAAACTGGNVTVELNRINVTFYTPVIAGTIVNITFNTTTPSSYNISNFTAYVNSTVSGLVLSTQSSLNSTIVTTQPIINVTNIVMTKGTALLNGMDYWEFKFVLAFTASQAGLIQFKMSNWTDVNGNVLGLINSTGGSHASLRNDTTNFSTTGKFSVTNVYADNVGINRANMPDDSFLHLRMMIPVGTAPSNTWSSTYNFLFRATP